MGASMASESEQQTTPGGAAASFAEKALRLSGKSEEEAQVLVDSVDHERADFIRKYFHVEWPEHAVFHTLLNTSIGDQCVVQMILSLKNSLDGCAVPAAAEG